MNPRDYAVLSLDEKRLPGLPRQTFKRRSPVAPADPRDRALGEQIVLGVVKNYLHLSWLVSHFANRPAEQIDARAKLILVVALYQLRFLDRVPEHAIVKEAVAQTRRLGEPSLPRAAGFVNAVLREAIREPDVADKLPKRTDPDGYAELVLSHPRPLFAKLEALLGVEDALQFCEHDNRTPPTLVRLIRGRTLEDLRRAGEKSHEATPAQVDQPPESDDFAAVDPADGRDSGAGGDPLIDEPARVPALEILPHEQPGIVVVRGGKQADFARWAEMGIGQVQDATSAAIVGFLNVGSGMTVLDRCCGVGTKTQQLAETTGAAGRVYAVDELGSRVSTLRRLIARRADLSNVTAKRAAWMSELPPQWPAKYDRVLIDAPCSNSGVLARRAEARYADVDEASHVLPQIQFDILRDTWPSLADDGVLAYATCSVFFEENSGVVNNFLATHLDAELILERLALPSFTTDDPARYRDGGYVALLRRRA